MNKENRDRDEGVVSGSVSRDIVADETCAVAVVDAVATVTRQDVAALPERLSDTVDTDALESLVATPAGATCRNLSVSFRFCDCHVIVSGDRTVHVRRAVEPSE